MTRRLIVALASIAALATACGGGSEPAPDSASEVVIVLEFENGELVGGARRESVDLGSAVALTVEGSIDEQVHVHGYDLYVEPDGPATLEFDALIPGRFEVELEQSGQLLIELTVS